MSYIDNIKDVNFPENQYFKQEFAKTQIAIHHTVSGPGVMGVVNWWLSTPDRIATSIIIDRNGDIIRCFSTKYWAYHLGVRSEDIIASGIAKYNRLDYNCIGVELDSWGGLVKHTDGKWYPATWDTKKKKSVPNTKCTAVENVTEYPKGFRGFYGFESYTAEQIEALKELLLYWNKTWNIPLDYHPTMWELSADALSGAPGIWTHVSMRTDKSDTHPQLELKTMLQSLKS